MSPYIDVAAEVAKALLESLLPPFGVCKDEVLSCTATLLDEFRQGCGEPLDKSRREGRIAPDGAWEAHPRDSIRKEASYVALMDSIRFEAIHAV